MDNNKPVAGKDYPATWSQFQDWFSSDDACRAYLEQLRWPRGFVCPECGALDWPSRASRGRLICRACSYQCSVTAGTIYDKTRTALRVWFAAAWYITSQKQGVSALGLQRVLGLGSYQTAWAMLHRFRRAMVHPERELLHGIVEIDEAYLALRRGVSAQTRKKSTDLVAIVVAVEVLEPKGFGRIRLRRIDAPTTESVMPFVKQNVHLDATVCTDGSAIYRMLGSEGFAHHSFAIAGSQTLAHDVLPGVHRVASLLKRWLLGTHHGAVHPRHIDQYLDEFTFRFNRRKSRSRGMLFYRLMQQSTLASTVTYADIRDNTYQTRPLHKLAR